MKIYNTFFALLAISGIITSCSNEEKDILPSDNEKILLSFSVASEKPELTRANFDGFTDKDKYADFYWEEGDEIQIFQPTSWPTIATVTVTTVGSDPSQAHATGYAPNDSNDPYYIGVYPASSAQERTTDEYAADPYEVKVNLKGNQCIYADHDYCVDKEAIIQVGKAKKEENKPLSMSMETPCSFLVFDTSLRKSKDNKSISDIKKVTVEAFKSTGEPWGICGRFGVRTSQSGSITLSTDPSTANHVELTYGDNQNFPQGKFAVAIRPGAPGYLLITVTTENGSEVYKAENMPDPVEPENEALYSGLDFKRAHFHLFPSFPPLDE